MRCRVCGPRPSRPQGHAFPWDDDLTVFKKILQVKRKRLGPELSYSKPIVYVKALTVRQINHRQISKEVTIVFLAIRECFLYALLLQDELRWFLALWTLRNIHHHAEEMRLPVRL